MASAIRRFRRTFTVSIKRYDYKSDAVIRSFVERQCAWCDVLGDALRGNEVSGHLNQFISPANARYILSIDNRPNALLLTHGLAIRQLYDADYLTDFQIMRPYTSFTLPVFIYLFAAILPFCVEAELDFLDVPLVTLIASTFILIDKSAIQLQDPFENKPMDTPMTTIARTIEINLKTMASFESIPDKLVPDDYYAL